jgi:eukaryotic-like serine/threonine-protein kinase
MLHHPNIIAIRELGKLPDGRPFCIMEFLGGSMLDELIRTRGRLSPEEALDILEPVCSALSAAHDAGIVHRDIKPSNVAILTEGDRLVVKLLDFGIAKLTDPELNTGFTSVGKSIGTITAMAPEQITARPVDARTDVYALGVMLYRMLTGQPPFASPDPMEIALQHLEAPPPRPSRRAPVSPSLDAVVLRSMEKKPEHRFESAAAFLSALREAVGRPVEVDEVQTDHSAAAVAIYVELYASTTGDELDGALALDMGNVLDMAEDWAQRDNYTVLLSTGTSVLAGRPLSPEMDERRRERREALEAAAALFRAIAARDAADERLHVVVCVHVQGAVVRMGKRPEIIAGPVTRMTSWVLPAGLSGLYATSEAVEDLPGVALADAPSLPAVSSVGQISVKSLTLHAVA